MREGEDQLEWFTGLLPQPASGEGGQRLFVGDVCLGDPTLDLIGGQIDQLVILDEELVGDRQDRSEELVPGDPGHGIGQLVGRSHRRRGVAPIERPPFEDGFGQLPGGPFEESQHLQLVTAIGVLLPLGQRSEEGLAEHLALVGLDPQLGRAHARTVRASSRPASRRPTELTLRIPAGSARSGRRRPGGGGRRW